MKHPKKGFRSARKKWVRILTNRMLWRNPVLAGALGTYAVLAGAKTFLDGAALSLMALCLTVPVCVMGSLLGRRLPPWLRISLPFLLTAALYGPAHLLTAKIFPSSIWDAGACCVAMAANSMILYRASRYAPEHTLSATLADALGASLGYAVVLMLVSGVWEFLKLLEREGESSFSNAPVVVGLVILACLSAALQYCSFRREKKGGKTL